MSSVSSRSERKRNQSEGDDDGLKQQKRIRIDEDSKPEARGGSLQDSKAELSRDRRFSPEGTAPKMSAEQRERKRLINRLSAQRKRQRERYQLDTLTDQYTKYARLNSALTADNERLKKLEGKMQSFLPAIKFTAGGLSHMGIMAKIDLLEMLRSALIECIESVEPAKAESFASDPAVAVAAATAEMEKTETPFGSTTAFLSEKLKLLDATKQIILQAALGQQAQHQQQRPSQQQASLHQRNQPSLGSSLGSLPFAITTATGGLHSSRGAPNNNNNPESKEAQLAQLLLGKSGMSQQQQQQTPSLGSAVSNQQEQQLAQLLQGGSARDMSAVLSLLTDGSKNNINAPAQQQQHSSTNEQLAHLLGGNNPPSQGQHQSSNNDQQNQLAQLFGGINQAQQLQQPCNNDQQQQLAQLLGGNNLSAVLALLSGANQQGASQAPQQQERFHQQQAPAPAVQPNPPKSDLERILESLVGRNAPQVEQQQPPPRPSRPVSNSSLDNATLSLMAGQQHPPDNAAVEQALQQGNTNNPASDPNLMRLLAETGLPAPVLQQILQQHQRQQEQQQQQQLSSLASQILQQHQQQQHQQQYNPMSQRQNQQQMTSFQASPAPSVSSSSGQQGQQASSQQVNELLQSLLQSRQGNH